MNILITYCGGVKLSPPGLQFAGRHQRPSTASSADLKEGSGGIFFVDIDGKRVCDNQITYRFPEDEEIFTEIDKLKA